eukprot:gene23783-25347_t
MGIWAVWLAFFLVPAFSAAYLVRFSKTGEIIFLVACLFTVICVVWISSIQVSLEQRKNVAVIEALFGFPALAGWFVGGAVGYILPRRKVQKSSS